MIISYNDRVLLDKFNVLDEKGISDFLKIDRTSTVNSYKLKSILNSSEFETAKNHYLRILNYIELDELKSMLKKEYSDFLISRQEILKNIKNKNIKASNITNMRVGLDLKHKIMDTFPNLLVYESAQLNSISIRSDGYSQVLLDAKSNMESYRILTRNPLVVEGAYSVVKYYMKNAKLHYAMINPRQLKEFMLIEPRFPEIENPILNSYPENLKVALRLRGINVQYDNIYSVTGARLETDLKNGFITKMDLRRFLGLKDIDISRDLFTALMFYKMYGLYSEDINFNDKIRPKIFFLIKAELKDDRDSFRLVDLINNMNIGV